jgi:hypothetical protein
VIGLGLNVATSLMAIAWSSYLLATQPDYLVTQESEDPENLGLILVDGLQSLFAFVVLLFTIVVFCLWLRRSNAALRTGGVSGLRFTPGWAVGWWFVPFANLYKPYEVMVELWRATTPGRDDWAFAPRSPALGWWWGFWIVSSLAGNAAARLTWNAESPEASHTALVASAVTDSLAVPAAVLAAWLVWKIQERLEQKLGSPPALTRRSA